MTNFTDFTWYNEPIVTDTAHLPYSHCAYLSASGPVDGPIAYGHSEEQAVDNLIAQLEAEQDARNLEDLCECDGEDPSVGYVGTVCGYCKGEYSQASELDADAFDAEWRESRKEVA